MTLYRNLLVLAMLVCMGWSGRACAQASTPLPPAPARTLLTRADTVVVLQEMFQRRRKNSGLFLAATPVTMGITLVSVGAGIGALLDGSGNSNGTLPVVGIGGGILGTTLLLNRYTRYTRGNEKVLLSRYERKKRLPRWAKRDLREQLMRPAG